MSTVYRKIDDHGVVRIIISGPGKGNRYDRNMMASLNGAIELCEIDKAARVVVLEGEGEDFSAGPDLMWLRRLVDFDYAANRVDTELMANVLHQIYTLRKPIIAKIRGRVVGAGVGLVAACDVAICDTTATFCFPEASLGMLPAISAPYVVAAIGQRRAMRYFLTGEEIPALEAARIGLVSQVFKSESLDAAVSKVCTHLLSGGPRTMNLIKGVVRNVAHIPIDRVLVNKSIDWTAAHRTTVEGRDGLRAFLDGASPPWVQGASTERYRRVVPQSHVILGGDVPSEMAETSAGDFGHDDNDGDNDGDLDHRDRPQAFDANQAFGSQQNDKTGWRR